ncbi:MAG TPA: FliM/FliN family flagellar motor C-terminal domain-containing protein [Phycisphaerales bacterium]|nr:FliM/FliN family flagellar motor C-terminal domain-containing protein [Phycisphaerales bacterium]
MNGEIEAILRLEVPVIVRLGERLMTLREVMALVPGAIIEIPKLADDELDLMINNERIGIGTAVKVGENFGLRLTAVGTPERIADAISRRLEEKMEAA